MLSLEEPLFLPLCLGLCPGPLSLLEYLELSALPRDLHSERVGFLPLEDLLEGLLEDLLEDVLDDLLEDLLEGLLEDLLAGE